MTTSNNASQGGCTVRLLASSAVGNVSACPGCGHVQLTLEYLTLRLEPDAFRELSRMLVEAQTVLNHRGAPARADAAPAGDGQPGPDAHLH
jgi:hypothetical protein